MKKKYIPIVNGKESAKVDLDDIIIIQREKRKICVISEDETFKYYGKMENVEPLLDQRFYPCLKGCYINFDRVILMREQKISFDNGEELFIGRENFVKTKQKYSLFN